jgi:hypothetical protein
MWYGLAHSRAMECLQIRTAKKNDRSLAIDALSRIGVDGTPIAVWEESGVCEDYTRATNHNPIDRKRKGDGQCHSSQ